MGEKQGLRVAGAVGRMPFEVTRGGSILVGIPPAKRPTDRPSARPPALPLARLSDPGTDE